MGLVALDPPLVHSLAGVLRSQAAAADGAADAVDHALRLCELGSAVPVRLGERAQTWRQAADVLDARALLASSFELSLVGAGGPPTPASGWSAFDRQALAAEFGAPDVDRAAEVRADLWALLEGRASSLFPAWVDGMHPGGLAWLATVFQAMSPLELELVLADLTPEQVAQLLAAASGLLAPADAQRLARAVASVVDVTMLADLVDVDLGLDPMVLALSESAGITYGAAAALLDLDRLAQVERAIAGWSGTDNDPVLDELLRERRTLLTSLEADPVRFVDAQLDWVRSRQALVSAQIAAFRGPPGDPSTQALWDEYRALAEQVRALEAQRPQAQVVSQLHRIDELTEVIEGFDGSDNDPRLDAWLREREGLIADLAGDREMTWSVLGLVNAGSDAATAFEDAARSAFDEYVGGVMEAEGVDREAAIALIQTRADRVDDLLDDGLSEAEALEVVGFEALVGRLTDPADPAAPVYDHETATALAVLHYQAAGIPLPEGIDGFDVAAVFEANQGLLDVARDAARGELGNADGFISLDDLQAVVDNPDGYSGELVATAIAIMSAADADPEIRSQFEQQGWFDSFKDGWLSGDSVVVSMLTGAWTPQSIQKVIENGPGAVSAIVSGAWEISSMVPGSPSNLYHLWQDPEGLVDNYQSFGSGAWNWATSTATLAAGLVVLSTPGGPEAFRVVTGRDLRAEALDMGESALRLLVSDPDEFALTMIGWDEFVEDPARWAGENAPDIALEIATGGYGTAAIASRRGLGALADVADVATDVDRALDGSAAVDLGRLDDAELPDTLFHYTREEYTEVILRDGLWANTFATPTELGSLQAALELALPPNRPLPERVIEIDVTAYRDAGFEIPTPTRVRSSVTVNGRTYHLPGGGLEVQIPDAVPPEFLRLGEDLRPPGPFLDTRRTFPSTADEMTELLGVTPTVDRNGGGFLRYRWEPNARTRITFESHPEPGVLPGTEGFTPRHHGEHFHVQIRPDASVGWNNRRVIKIEPPEYEQGSGRAFLPGETFPGVWASE